MTIPSPATYTTNSSGWISIEGIQANYYFKVSLESAGRSYNFSLPQGPLDTTNATLSLPSGNLSISLCNTMATANPCKTVASTSTYVLPPPTTTITDYGCHITGSTSNSSAVLLVDTGVGSVELDVGTSPSIPLQATGCSYVFTNTTTPMACGVMCGGGIGASYAYTYVWKLNFSLAQGGSGPNANLTLSQGAALAAIFPQRYIRISLDSQPVTWYSNPACYGGDGIESDCMFPSAISIGVELPASARNGVFQLVVNESAFLVP